MVNNCYAAVTLLLGKENSQHVDKFWEQDPLIWDTVNNVGLRANYIASVHAARLMARVLDFTLLLHLPIPIYNPEISQTRKRTDC